MGSTQSFEVEHSVPRKDRDPYSDKQSLTSPRTNLFLYIQMQVSEFTGSPVSHWPTSHWPTGLQLIDCGLLDLTDLTAV